MIPHFKGNLPFISPDQMKEIDRIMAEDFGISLNQTLENAGQNLAILAREKFLDFKPQGKKVIVIASPGANGGGVMVAARKLKICDAEVSILLSDKKGKFSKETVHQFSLCQKMKIPTVDTIQSADLIIDGMLSYDFQGNPSEKESRIIEMVNNSKAPVIALDTPSGLDLSVGRPGDPTVKAEATMIVALPKYGHFRQKSAAYVGELFLADINVPIEVFETLKIESENLKRVFGENPLVKINRVIIFS
jgi:NAD(P)H-hydrate epimerase